MPFNAELVALEEITETWTFLYIWVRNSISYICLTRQSWVNWWYPQSFNEFMLNKPLLLGTYNNWYYTKLNLPEIRIIVSIATATNFIQLESELLADFQ